MFTYISSLLPTACREVHVHNPKGETEAESDVLVVVRNHLCTVPIALGKKKDTARREHLSSRDYHWFRE